MTNTTEETTDERYDLVDADECPECGVVWDVTNTEERPAGYFHCMECHAIWAGDVRNAQLHEAGVSN